MNNRVTSGVHGFAIASDLGRGFSSNGREDKVSIVDLKTLQTIQKVGTAGNPDAITYEPTTHEVYAMWLSPFVNFVAL